MVLINISNIIKFKCHKVKSYKSQKVVFSDLPIDLSSPLAPLTYLFFLTFLFLIVVVLMNLLNGLAVSDTAIIRDKAEIFSYR